MAGGTHCKDEASLYTSEFVTRNGLCDGWKGVTLPQCKEFCSRNLWPPNCPDANRKPIRCVYVQYNMATKHCQLGKETCEPAGGNLMSLLFKKRGENLHIIHHVIYQNLISKF